MLDELGALFEDELVFNGVNAVTGGYGRPPLTTRTLARLIQGSPLPEDYRDFVAHQRQLGELTSVEDRLTRVTEGQLVRQTSEQEARLAELAFRAQRQAKWPVKPGAGDVARVEDVGWGVIYPADMPSTLREEIQEALQPLLELRWEQAGGLFRIYEGGSGYRAGERKDQFFARLGVSPGLVDPLEMPFYLLIVGTPEDIPYAFQYQLDVMRGVGRLDFGDDLDAYDAYARAVVAAEKGDVVLPRRAAFFAPSNAGDRATQISSRYLAQPLYENLTHSSLDFEVELSHEWELQPPFIGEGWATRRQLEQLLGGDPDQQPALLFTASHGIEFPVGHPAQIRHQGALLCQDWPGPGGHLRREHYFAGEDIAPDADLSGMMAFMFACYSAGTPQLDQFAIQAFKVREQIAKRGFTAALPQQLLKQGALAVLGHVERAWGYSFISPRGRLEHQAFITAMRTLMNGDPVGVATDTSFDMRYAEMSSDLSADLDELQWNADHLSDEELVHRWTATNDARSYVVLGDPAARLRFAAEEPGEEEAVEEAPAEEAPVEEAPPSIERPDLGPIVGPPEEPPPLDEILDETLAEAAAEPEIAAGTPEEAPTEHGPASAEPGAVVGEPRAAAVERESVFEQPEASSDEAERAPAAQGAVSWEAPVAVDLSREEAVVAFGLQDQFDRLRTSLQTFTAQLADSLGRAAEDIVTLDVRTYSTSDITRVAAALDAREEADAKLRALTRIRFDGDLQVYVPEKVDREVYQGLWVIHTAMVEEAQDSRAKFLATMAELATRLLDSLLIGS